MKRKHEPLHPSRRPPSGWNPLRQSTIREDGPRLESIEEDGVIDRALRRHAGSDSGELGSLIRTLKRDLERLRERGAAIAKGVMTCSSKEELFDKIQTADSLSLGESHDAVLLCVIAKIEELDGPYDELRDAACTQFQYHPSEYCTAFGELLPAELTDIAKQIDYRDNVNATAAGDIDAFEKRLDSLRTAVGRHGMAGVPTGLPKLDDALGGIRGLTLLGAQKGVGKTTLMLSAALSTLRRSDDAAALIFSFDESKDRLYQRLWCIAAGISFRQLLKPDSQHEAQLAQAKPGLLSVLPRLRIVERRVRHPQGDDYSGQTPRHLGFDFGALCEDLNTLRSDTGSNNVLICVDLFQKWPASQESSLGADQDHYRLDILDRLRRESFSRSSPDGYPMLVLSEIRKDAPRVLDLNDLKGDGRMSSDADCVLLMYPSSDARADSKNGVEPMTIRIAKGRDGVRRVEVPLWFDFLHYRFLEHDPRQEQQPPGSSGRQSADTDSRKNSRRNKGKSDSPGRDALAE